MDVVGIAVVGRGGRNDSLERGRLARGDLQAVETAPGDADHLYRPSQQRQDGADRKVPVADHRVHPVGEGPQPGTAFVQQLLDRKLVRLLEFPVREQRVEAIYVGTGQGLELGEVKIVQPDDGYVERS